MLQEWPCLFCMRSNRHSLHPNSSFHTFLLPLSATWSCLGSWQGALLSPPKWLPQVNPWQSTTFASHFPEAIHVSPEFPVINPYLSAHGKPVATLFTQISSPQISSLQHSASSYRFLINVLADFPGFGRKNPKTREGWRGRRKRAFACPHCR